MKTDHSLCDITTAPDGTISAGQGEDPCYYCIAKSANIKILELKEELRSAELCDSCAGMGESLTGGLCICLGTGNIWDAITTLRRFLLESGEREERERTRFEVVMSEILKKSRECRSEVGPALTIGDIARSYLVKNKTV